MNRLVIIAISLFALSSLIFLFNLNLGEIRETDIVSAQTSSTDWPQLQRDSQHTGRTTAFVAPDYEVAWAWMDKTHIVKNFVSAEDKNITDGFESGFKFTVLYAAQMQPIIGGGKIIVGSLNGVVYALNALTGATVWDFQTKASILSSAAYSNNTVIVTSMDGRIYGLNSDTGSKLWEYKTNSGISASPAIHNGVAYIGSRDGYFYALQIVSGQLIWKYETKIPGQVNSPFAAAPIFTPAAISADGTTVLFGAENMYVYALNTANGSEKWPPQKVNGQSFQYAWPVIKDDKVFFRTISSVGGIENTSGDPNIEPVLDALLVNPSWEEEKSAITEFNTQYPETKSMFVFDITNGQQPYKVAMGRVSGNNYAPHSPVVDNQNRLLTYWRSKISTVFQNTAFGSKYCSDISELNTTTGDRIKLSLPIPTISRIYCPELDNGFMLTVGGDHLYLQSSFRGTKVVNLKTGTNRGIANTLAKHDCSAWRGGNGDGFWGFQIIYYGNDDYVFPTPCDQTPRPGLPGYPIPEQLHDTSSGFSGIVIATTNGQSLLYINERNSIVALKHKQ